MKRDRLDKLLVARNLAPSRQRAQALILSGSVVVDDHAVTKAGALVPVDADIRLKRADHPYVSRGGLKLAGALDRLHLSVSGKRILDVGASTGGFTDCALQRGAAVVYAVDVGTNQLDYRLRTHPQVVSMEKTNARDLQPDWFPFAFDGAVIDVSFISLTKILEPVRRCVRDGGFVLAMVKPQFEVGRDLVGDGVVRDDALRRAAADKVVAYARTIGMRAVDRVDSDVLGPKGNREIFCLFTVGDAPP